MSRHPLLPTRRHLAVAVLAVCVATAVAVGNGAVVAGADGGLESGDGHGNNENATVVVADADSDERLLEVPVDEGEEIVLAYTHSVEKTDVEDVYVVEDGELRMDRMVFSSYGAGLPSEAAIDRTEDGFVVSVDRIFEEVHVTTGWVAGHELLVGEEAYDLVERANGSTVVLSVDDRPDGGGECP
ncbi:DUF1850 domain-containing protein [Natrialbaceae archaeon A-gly3]